MSVCNLFFQGGGVVIIGRIRYRISYFYYPRISRWAAIIHSSATQMLAVVACCAVMQCPTT